MDIDRLGEAARLRVAVEAERPKSVTVAWRERDYSTPRRHGEPHECFDGGALRSPSTVDTTVQPKAVTHPTDSKLIHRGVEILGRLARRHGVALRQRRQVRATRARP